MKEKTMLVARFGYGGRILISKEDIPRLEEVSKEKIRIAKRPGSGMTEEEAERLYSFEILEDED